MYIHTYTHVYTDTIQTEKVNRQKPGKQFLKNYSHEGSRIHTLKINNN